MTPQSPFAKLATDGRIAPDSAEADAGGDDVVVEDDDKPPAKAAPPVMPLPPARGVAIMDGERELTTGLLAKDASFRLIVKGAIGVKEIERLIRKLELDKEILADEGDESSTSGIEGLV